MYEEAIYDPDSEIEHYPEITYQELIREQIAPEFSNLSDEDIDVMLGEIFADMSPEEIEGFFGSLGSLARRAGRTLVKAAPTILPIAGGAVGTLIGGPAGTAIGAKLGGVAGRLVGSATTRRKRRRPATSPRLPQRPAPGGRPPVPGRQSAVPASGSSATAQLLALLNNPALLRSLLSRVLGAGGRTGVIADGEMIDVDCGSLLNALGELAAEAAREAHEDGVAGTGLPEYLLDEEGGLIDDAGRPEVRAELLLELLNASETEEQLTEYEHGAKSPEAWLMEAGLLET